MTRIKLSLPLLLVLFPITLLLSACSSRDINFNLSSSADLNRNSFNETLPMVVRVYQLTALETFKMATFEQLWQADELLLGGQLLAKHEVMLQPAGQADYQFSLHDDTEFVAVFAPFRRPDAEGWRWVHKVNNSVFALDSSFDLQLMNNKIYYQAD